MNDKEPLIDTNVLVHAYVLSHEEKHAVAKDIVQNIWTNGGGITTLDRVAWTNLFVRALFNNGHG